MRAEIIAIGSELLTPDHIDTNSLFLTRGLESAGFEVHLKTIVGDNAADMEAVFRAALSRSRVVLSSGGLGPTEDDITRAVVARLLGRSIRIDQGIVDAIRARFSSRGYVMPKINERQAEVIEGAEVLDNPRGTAPGQWVEANGSVVVLLPGPPREIEPMFETRVLPRLREIGAGRRMLERSFHVVGLTESDVDARVAPVYTKYQPAVSTTILSAPGHISLRSWQWLGAGEEPAALESLASEMLATLGDSIFTTAREPLEEVVGGMLIGSGRTIAVAESCTSGLVGWRLTRTPGSSAYFRGGILCYSNEAKVDLCGVSPEVLERHGAVSAEAAEALAVGIRRRFGSTIGLSVTGIAGPGGGSAEKPVGLIYVGLSDGERTSHTRRVLPGDREMVRERASFMALAALRRFLLDAGA
jgi:nicotinamide-nucleotide amidase